MKVLRLITQEVEAPQAIIFVMACVSGIANGLLIALINSGSAHAAEGRLEVSLIAAYILAILIFVLALHFSMTRSADAGERALLRLKLRIMNKLRFSELRYIEEQGGMSAYTPLTDGANLISQGLGMLVSAAQSALILIFAALYLGFLSPQTLIAIIIILAVLMPLVIGRRETIRDNLASASDQDARFFEGFTGILRGFKELKLNRPENDDLFAHIRKNADNSHELKVAVNAYQARNTILFYGIYFLVLMAAVFVVPTIYAESSETIHKVTATVLFMMTPIWPIATAIPVLARVENVVTRLYELEATIDRARDKTENDTPAEPVTSFNTIELAEVEFQYKDAEGQPLFSAGPFNLNISQGELVFIVGGNGSGKSTLLKLMTGLYRPQHGKILLDGLPVGASGYARYRTLFTSVFTDFHLFRKVQGVPGLTASQVDEWIDELKLSGKTHYTEQGFTNLELSTGQKKRLAIIAAILKQRPVCILDEPAADQDPPFRRYFYQELLPKLRDEGRTIVVVSHDDQYFHLADRVIHVRDGQLVERAV